MTENKIVMSLKGQIGNDLETSKLRLFANQCIIFKSNLTWCKDTK